MNRRQFLALPLATVTRAAPDHPNVVIFLADDLGWADVGFHGSETRTPNIVKLERDGGLDWNRDGRSLHEEGYSTDLIASEGIRIIKNRDKSKPLFLYMPFNAPHAPLQAPEKYIDKYASIKDEKRRRYCAMVDAEDYNIGRVLEALEQEGMTQNTLVLFFSDNGGPVNQGARNTPLRWAKATTSEG